MVPNEADDVLVASEVMVRQNDSLESSPMMANHKSYSRGSRKVNKNNFVNRSAQVASANQKNGSARHHMFDQIASGQ